MGAFSLLLLGAAGCTVPEFFQLSWWQTSPPAGHDPAAGAQFISGSLETVSESAQGTLRALGINVSARPEGERRVVLHCAARNNSQFALILERWPTPQGMTTRVDFAWESTPDNAVRYQVMGALTALNSR